MWPVRWGSRWFAGVVVARAGHGGWCMGRGRGSGVGGVGGALGVERSVWGGKGVGWGGGREAATCGWVTERR